MSDLGRPTKRARLSPSPPPHQPLTHNSPSTDPPRDGQPPLNQPAELTSEPLPMVFQPLFPPQAYIPAAGVAPTQVGLPTHLTSFSYSPDRKLLLDPETRDQALQHYKPPPMGADLNRGFHDCVWGEGRPDESLDALTLSLSDWIERDSTGQAETQLAKVEVITWRGMMTKLMTAVYETEQAIQKRRTESWEMNAMMIDGVLYLEDAASPAKRAAKAKSEQSYRQKSYYGYSFESYSTVDPPQPGHPSPPIPPPDDTFSPPNTNVQWCSVVKSNIGGVRVILGGEVDCVKPSASSGRISTADFIELKTNIAIGSVREEEMFERNKLLKHYVQSFLLGVPEVIVGFRTREGIVTGLQTFKTLEIPRLVRGKRHGWNPLATLASARQLLGFLLQSLKSHPANTAYHAAIDTRPADSTEAGAEQLDTELPADAPVFRVSFAAGGPDSPGVSVRQLSRAEVREEVLGDKQEAVGGGRVGFLLEGWVRARIEARRRRVQAGGVGEGDRGRVPAKAQPAPAFVLQR